MLHLCLFFCGGYGNSVYGEFIHIYLFIFTFVLTLFLLIQHDIYLTNTMLNKIQKIMARFSSSYSVFLEVYEIDETGEDGMKNMNVRHVKSQV